MDSGTNTSIEGRPAGARPRRRTRLATGALALAATALLPGLTGLTIPVAPASAATTAPAAASEAGPGGPLTLGDPVAALSDLDIGERLAPAASQLDAARSLGLVDVRWNDLGTPTSLLPADGVLGVATSADPVEAARTWLRHHAAVFGLDADQMDRLELVGAQEFAGGSTPSGTEIDSPARAVLFQQDFGGLAPARGGLVTVGVADGAITYVSSSLARTDAAPEAARLSPVEGWLAAALDVRPTLADEVADGLSDRIGRVVRAGWTRLTVPGFAQEQQVRLRALPLVVDGITVVRPVLEANVVDAAGGTAMAYTVNVDAVTGDILTRQNQVENSSRSDVFSGAFTGTTCGPEHEFELTDGATRSITAVGLALPVDDITVKLFDPDGELLLTQDLLTSPEVATYTADRIPAGVYTLQVCPFDTASAVVGQYSLLVTSSDTETPDGSGLGFSPRWTYFAANPAMTSLGTGAVPQNRVTACWLPGPGCTSPTGPLRNVAATYPWDALDASGTSTLTTIGNNANTHEAWVSPLTPGGAFQAPVSPTREYAGEFTDAWNESRCNPANLVPGGNDIDASVTNLFVSHNRMHDYSYYLGFTEDNYNMQTENHGRGGVEGDPEIGNAQAGAITGANYLTGLGRDNANQITLQDGIPGITNQYLFQPIAGAFYAPCTDGGLDMGIVGHEYTHAISNRMVAGPDEGLTSEQGGAMGESWSDLVAAEYQFSHGYRNGGNIWAVGVYATGNKQVAIRDYAINRNPLNYSDYGFDSTGAEVHSDGEIWNGTQWSVRQALVRKHDRRFPYDDERLQLRCAQATADRSPLAAQFCPGNRRWVQLMFDSFLLQQGATSMLDARDAMLAADRMRFGGANQRVLWKAFAARGMGRGASTPDADSSEVRPSFASPRERNARITFRTPGRGRVFVGHYEARVTPVADTLPKSALGRSAVFAPGRYRLLFASPARGFVRFAVTVRPGRDRVVRVRAPRNLAAAAAGATVISATEGSRNPAHLIDGTEATNWGGVTTANVDETQPSVAVDLAGGVHRVRRVQVSAMLTPAPAEDSPIPLAQADPDPDSGSRFTALRRFALEACVAGCDTADATWRRFYVSPRDAFPGVRPRPVAPDLTLRSFRVPPTRAAAIRLVALENQCTGGPGYAGEQDDDPLNDTDCATASDRGTIVHAAELQVF
ncbi:M36 family metallopeptidase [Nocardioides ferulae]|uniref:M36 family metallopeptidase n=1 Tax=Nocardioides ferulae TaxID=2340821 RepID=UPI000EAC126A|nr:M36 family metallopeptidase [Nocardioides ferulae]